MIGWYPGDEIVIFPLADREGPPGIVPLGFVFAFKGGSGSFATTFSVSDPSGKLLVKPAAIEAQAMQANKVHLLAVQMNSLRFEMAGEYKATLQLEKKAYDFTFKVTFGEPSSHTLPKKPERQKGGRCRPRDAVQR